MGSCSFIVPCVCRGTSGEESEQVEHAKRAADGQAGKKVDKEGIMMSRQDWRSFEQRSGLKIEKLKDRLRNAKENAKYTEVCPVSVMAVYMDAMGL